MLRIFLVLLFAAAASADDVIDCTGPFAPATSEQALIAKYGKNNVKHDTIYVAEGGEEEGTVLFPGDAKRRLEIVWKNKKQRKSPEWMRVRAESRWSVFGLRTGATLADLVKRNGRDFKFSGFGWDYGGAVIDWRGGAMNTLGGKTCHVGVSIDPVYPDNPSRAEEAALNAVSGDSEFLSSSSPLKKLKVRVSEIVVSY
ncbi:MAG TPA: hypothetical protein VM733_18540 [Thermoanaerobaculia bacterium]|nr:hypothetical protein [Thermoanaerobaculia bacterium]